LNFSNYFFILLLILNLFFSLFFIFGVFTKVVEYLSDNKDRVK